MAIKETKTEYQSEGSEFNFNNIDQKDIIIHQRYNELEKQLYSGELNVKPFKIYRISFNPKNCKFTWCIGCDMSFNPNKSEEYYKINNGIMDDNSNVINYYTGESKDMIPPIFGWKIVNHHDKNENDRIKFEPVPTLIYIAKIKT